MICAQHDWWDTTEPCPRCEEAAAVTAAETPQADLVSVPPEEEAELPDVLKLSAEVRAAAWEGKTVFSLAGATFEDVGRKDEPDVAAFRETQRVKRNEDIKKRLDKPKAKIVDHTNERWDARRGKWVAL